MSDVRQEGDDLIMERDDKPRPGNLLAQIMSRAPLNPADADAPAPAGAPNRRKRRKRGKAAKQARKRNR